MSRSRTLLDQKEGLIKMWICFNDAFISIVEDKATGMMKVRARKRKHLTVLFPDAEIHESNKTDYRFRVFVERWEVTAVTSRAILGEGPRAVTYDNFKDSVKDATLHDLYAAFWRLHNEYQ